MLRYQEIASMIDHALLKPTLTDREVIDGCRMADAYQTASVCVRPCDVSLAREVLKNSKVLVTTVIGFPLGVTTTGTKAAEAKEAIENGAKELDVVLNIAKLKSGDLSYVKRDLEAVVIAAHHEQVPVKVIFENCYLTDAEKVQACQICNEIDADYVKTSTGFGSGGATEDDLILMRKYADPGIRLKASGGIKTLERVLRMKELGCTRVGSSSTVEILEELKRFLDN